MSSFERSLIAWTTTIGTCLVNLTTLTRRIKHLYPHLTYREIMGVLQLYQGQVLTELMTQGQSSIRSLGTITLKIRPPHKARNPQNGEAIEVPQRVAAKFKFSKAALHVLKPR